MRRVKLLLVIAFLLVFAAGAVVGMVRENRPTSHTDHDGLPIQLNLSAAQEQQMKSIWSGVVDLRKQADGRWRQLEQEREDGVLAILSPQQKAQYDGVQQQFRNRTQELDNQFQQAVTEAEGKTRQMLTPEQQAKFDQIRKEHGGHMRHMMGHRGPMSAPSSHPERGASAPANPPKE